MALSLDPQTKAELAARLAFYREMGIYGLYRRPVDASAAIVVEPLPNEDEALPRKANQVTLTPANPLAVLPPKLPGPKV